MLSRMSATALFPSLQALSPQIIASWHLLRTRIIASRALEKVPLSTLLSQLSSPETPDSGIKPVSLSNALRVVERWLTYLHLVPNTCLYRSLGRYAALASVGIPVRFVMGVCRDGDNLLGHAWLEHAGVPLNETIDPRYVITYAYPPLDRSTLSIE
jgi:hypothetical protein